MALTTNLLHYWSLNNTLDDSVGANDGSATDDSRVAAISGEGKHFAENDNTISISDLNLSGDFTLATWVKTENYATSAGAKYFFDNNSPRFILGQYYTIGSGKNLYFYLGSGNIDTGFELTDAGWTHIVVTRNSGYFKIYCNGVLQYSHPTLWTNTLTGTQKIGNVWTGSGNAFNGQMDSFSVWNRGFSQTDVDELYNDGLGMFYDETTSDFIEGTNVIESLNILEGLEACYNLDDDLTDEFGNNDLTHSGTPTYETGKKGNGLKLNGSEYASKASFDETLKSFGGWINVPSEITNSSSQQILLDFKNAGSTLQGKLILGYSGVYATDSTLTLAKEDVNEVYDRTYIKETLSAGWHHIWFNWNGSDYDIWLDGDKKTTYSSSDYGAGDVNIYTTTQLTLGDINLTDNPVNIIFDGWFFYSPQKADGLIKYLYNSGNGKFLQKPTLGSDSDILSSLLHFYSLDGHARDSIGNWHGEVVNGFGVNNELNQDKCYSANGIDQHIKFNGNLDISSFPVSFSLWVKDIHNETFGSLITGNTTTAYCSCLMRNIPNGVLSAQVGDGTGTSSSDRLTFNTANYAVTENVKHHLVFVFNAYNDVDVYIDNGSKIDIPYLSGTATSVNFTNALYTFCLDNQNGLSRKTDNMEQVAIYDCALSATQRTKLYNSGNGLDLSFTEYELIEPYFTSSVSINATFEENADITVGAIESGSILMAAQFSQIGELNFRLNGSVSMDAIFNESALLKRDVYASVAMNAEFDSTANLLRVLPGSVSMDAVFESSSELKLVKVGSVSINVEFEENATLGSGQIENGLVSMQGIFQGEANLNLDIGGSVSINAFFESDANLNSGGIEHGSVSISANFNESADLDTGGIENASVSMATIFDYSVELSTGSEEYGHVSMSAVFEDNALLSTGAIENGSVSMNARFIANPILGSCSFGAEFQSTAMLSLYYDEYKVENYNVNSMVGGPGWIVGDILKARLVDYDERGVQQDIYKLKAFVIGIIAEGKYLISITGREEDWEIFERYNKRIKFVKSGNRASSQRSNYVVMSADDWNENAHNPHITGYVNVREMDEVDSIDKMIFKLGNQFGVEVPGIYTGYKYEDVAFNEVGYALLEDEDSRPADNTGFEWESSGDKKIPKGIYYIDEGVYLHISYSDSPHADIISGDEEIGTSKEYIVIGVSNDDTTCLYMKFYSYDQMLNASKDGGLLVENEDMPNTTQFFLYLAYRNAGSPTVISDDWTFSTRKVTGEKYGLTVFGDTYIGSKTGSSYFKYDEETEEMTIAANLTILNPTDISVYDLNGGTQITTNKNNITAQASDINGNVAKINLAFDNFNTIVQRVSSLNRIGYLRTNYNGTRTSLAIYNDSGETLYVKDGDKFEIINENGEYNSSIGDYEFPLERTIVTANGDQTIATGNRTLYINSVSVVATYLSGISIMGVTHESHIKQTADSLELAVSDIENNSAAISINAGEIDLRVTTADLANPSSGLTIAPGLITISGDTVFEDDVVIVGDFISKSTSHGNEIKIYNRTLSSLDEASILEFDGSGGAKIGINVTTTGDIFEIDSNVGGRLEFFPYGNILFDSTNNVFKGGIAIYNSLNKVEGYPIADSDAYHCFRTSHLTSTPKSDSGDLIAIKVGNNIKYLKVYE